MTLDMSCLSSHDLLVSSRHREHRPLTLAAPTYNIFEEPQPLGGLRAVFKKWRRCWLKKEGVGEEVSEVERKVGC